MLFKCNCRFYNQSSNNASMININSNTEKITCQVIPQINHNTGEFRRCDAISSGCICAHRAYVCISTYNYREIEWSLI
uniref:Uncharacterized protein n=1 Tax=Trichogramma kaykai TaxID=54128 RepID=A0ABD2WLL6_9HYME